MSYKIFPTEKNCHPGAAAQILGQGHARSFAAWGRDKRDAYTTESRAKRLHHKQEEQQKRTTGMTTLRSGE